MHQLRACGVLVTRGRPLDSFLLLRHPTRWDLPKGHVEPGESDETCALRELEEETGIRPEQIELDPTFRFEIHYRVRPKHLGNEEAEKTVVIFLGRLLEDVPLKLTEHDSYEWFPSNPPHAIQAQTIDPLLAQVAQHLGQA